VALMDRRCHPAWVTRRAWIQMSVLAALWGASYMFIKVALDDVSPFIVVWVRLVLAALVLLPIAYRRGALGELRPHLATVLFLSIVQVAAPFLLITFGEKHIASSLAGILVASAPIFTALLAIRLDRAELATGWRLVGIMVGIVGVALLFGVDLSGDSAALLGGLMVLLASLGYAIGPFEMKRKLQGVQPVGIAAATMSVAALLVTPVVPFVWPAQTPGVDTIASLFVLGAGGTGVAFLIFYTLIAEVGPGRATVVAYIAPAFSVLYGVVLLGESVTAGTAAGLLLILGGSWLAAGGGKISRSALSRSSVPEPARAR
jgi:drug/metabolite transporter (DMT)-like permease